MIGLIFSFILVFFTSLNAYEASGDNEFATPLASSTKVLYLSFEKLPKRVIKGEIFSVGIKTLSTVKNFSSVTYRFSNSRGVRLLNKNPVRKRDAKYLHDTFYFLTTSSRAKIPDFIATLHSNSGNTYRKSRLIGQNLDVVTLNPKDDFSNLIANSFKILDYKTSNFDTEHNIVVFSAIIKNANVKAFKFKNIFKQGFESIKRSGFNSKITYYAVINKDIENFSFSYFNLKENKFLDINIPITVVDDSVTTQSDLKPKNQSKERLKMGIAGVISIVFIIFVVWRKKYIYLIFVLIPLIYIGLKAIPSKEVSIKKGASIYLLPVKNGTIFEKTTQKIYLQKEGEVKNFIKVKLKNEKIGWVRNEDIDKS